MMQVDVEVLEVIEEAIRYGRTSAAGARAKRRGGAFKPLRSGARSGRVKVYRIENLEVAGRV